MAKVAPGYRSSTAWASTWAVEWRMVCRPRSEAAVTIATDAPSGHAARSRSLSSPSTTATTASAASLGPMEAARSAALDPSASSRAEPSGNETEITDIDSEATAAPRSRAAARGSEHQLRNRSRRALLQGNSQQAGRGVHWIAGGGGAVHSG